jgi:glycogen operon protein
MSDADWNAGHVCCVGMGLPGDQITEIGERGERIRGDTLALLCNAHHEPIDFRLGARRRDVRWTCVLDTAAPEAATRTFEHMSTFPLQARSLVLLRAEILASDRSAE